MKAITALMMTLVVLTSGAARADIRNDLIGNWTVSALIKNVGQKAVEYGWSKQVKRLRNGDIHVLDFYKEGRRTIKLSEQWLRRDKTTEMIAYGDRNRIESQGFGTWRISGSRIIQSLTIDDIEGSYKYTANLRRLSRNKWVLTASDSYGNRITSTTIRTRK